MLAEALQAEVDAYIARHIGERDADGRRLVVRNGSHQPREVLTSAGAVEVTAPRVNDRRCDPDTGQRRRFASAILPAWCRKTPKITEVLPLLYLHGLSSGDFAPALGSFLGSSAGLSASAITKLTETWKTEQRAFAARDLSGVDYVYCWADGIHVNIRLEEHKLCLLVLIGVRADGRKELVALADGYRESTESWADLLRDCARRGMRAPVLAVGDGALGFWGALREVFPATREQRCWFHRSCKGSTWWCRGVLVGGERGEDVGCGGEPGGGGGGGEAVLGQDRADFTDEVADGAPADLEQFGEGVLGAQLALVEYGREHSLVVGDLLLEHTSAGAGQAFPATVAVAVALVARVLDVPDACGHRGQLDAGQTGEGGIGKPVGHPRALRLGLIAGDELGQRARGGEPQRGRWDRVMVVVEQLASLRDRLADGARVDPQQVRQHVLRADLAQVDDGDQHAVGARQQPRAARAGCPAALSTALFKPALGGLGFLGGGQRLGERDQLVAAHAGQPLIGQQVQRRVPRAGAFLGADRRDLPAGGGDGVVPLPVLGVRFDRQQPQLLAAHGDPEGVVAGVQLGVHPQPGAGAGRGDGGHHNLVAG